MPRANKTIDEIEKAADREKEQDPPVNKIFLSTGSTLLNLGCSDVAYGAIAPGVLVNIIGDSHAGKTFLAHSIVAEAILSEQFKDHDIYYDNPEAAPVEGIRRLFGNVLVDKIKDPSKDGCSGTIQEWRRNVWRIMRFDRPFIHITDSLDSLHTEEAEQKLNDEIDGKKEKGSMGMEKPKVMSGILGPMCRKLEKTTSILIILSQTRQNIGMSFAPKKRAGGDALEFYSALVMWLARAGAIKVEKEKRTRIIGNKVRVKVSKSKITGKVREVDFSIYNSYGIDDIGSCVDFLVDEKIWNKKETVKSNSEEKKEAKTGNTILASDLKLEGTKEKLIKQIEEKGLEQRLQLITGKYWKKIEDSFKLNRKAKYE